MFSENGNSDLTLANVSRSSSGPSFKNKTKKKYKNRYDRMRYYDFVNLAAPYYCNYYDSELEFCKLNRNRMFKFIC